MTTPPPDWTVWYTKKMIEAHDAGQFTERNNYAKMAGVDFVRFFYL